MLPLILQPMLAMFRYYETRFQLQKLDRRILADIGFEDGELDAFIREHGEEADACIDVSGRGREQARCLGQEA